MNDLTKCRCMQTHVSGDIRAYATGDTQVTPNTVDLTERLDKKGPRADDASASRGPGSTSQFFSAELQERGRNAEVPGLTDNQ